VQGGCGLVGLEQPRLHLCRSVRQLSRFFQATPLAPSLIALCNAGTEKATFEIEIRCVRA